MEHTSKLMKKNRKITTCSRLYLETLRILNDYAQKSPRTLARLIEHYTVLFISVSHTNCLLSTLFNEEKPKDHTM